MSLMTGLGDTVRQRMAGGAEEREREGIRDPSLGAPGGTQASGEGGERDMEGHPQVLCWQEPWLASVSCNLFTSLFVISSKFSVVLLLFTKVKTTSCSTTMLPGLQRGDMVGLEGVNGGSPPPPRPTNWVPCLSGTPYLRLMILTPS